MKRPSRGERWSVTTTRQIGFFLLPTRFRRTRTDMRRRRLAAASQLLQIRYLALRELAHQLLHLRELLDELADGLHVGARSVRDPSPARPVDHGRVGPLLGRHRLDDGLEAVELLLVHVEVAEL